MPYGMALAEWDVLLSEMDVEILFQQLAVINRARAHCLILGCIWHDMGRIRLAMLANGYTDVHVLVVYKPQQNTSGMEWINALEHLVVGYKGGIKACRLTFSDLNPIFRHNVLFSHQVGPKLRFAGQEVVVNETQKNPNVASAIGRIMCTPGSRALVLGAGSGSEVVGLARIGVNVVGVERDTRQFQALTQRITAEAAAPDDALRNWPKTSRKLRSSGNCRPGSRSCSPTHRLTLRTRKSPRNRTTRKKTDLPMPAASWSSASRSAPVAGKRSLQQTARRAARCSVRARHCIGHV